MCSVGLSLIFGTTGLTNFAHGEMVTFGAMVAYLFNDLGLHILLAAPIAVVAGGIFGWALNDLGFARLRQRGIGLISQMVITLGMSIALKNLYLWYFGGRDKPFLNYTNQVGKKIGPITITPRDLIVTILGVIVLVAVALTLQYTRLGKATRAVSDNVDLASSTGIDSAKVIRIIWIAGGALAALGGIFRGLDEQVGWDMGTSPAVPDVRRHHARRARQCVRRARRWRRDRPAGRDLDARVGPHRAQDCAGAGAVDPDPAGAPAGHPRTLAAGRIGDCDGPRSSDP